MLIRGFAQVFVASVAVLALYHQTAGWMVSNWLLNPYMNYGALVPAISAYLVWKERSKFRVSFEPRGLFPLAAAALLYFSPLYIIKAVSLVVFVAGSFLMLFGFETLRKIAFPLAFLLLMIPLPDYMVEYVGLHLRAVSVDAAVSIAGAFYGIEFIQDTYIKAGDLTLYVGLPCSGIESFLGFGVFAVLFAYLFEKGWRRILLVALCLGMTMAMNALRIVLVIISGIYLGEAAAMGVFHTLSGMVLISVYTIILMFVYRGRIWKT